MRAAAALAILFASSCHSDPQWARAPALAGGEASMTSPIRVPRFSARPVLDGKLDDVAWSGSAALGPFVDPGSGVEIRKHPVAAWARLGWDDQALYLGVVVRDRSPGSPFGRDDRDPHVWGQSSGIELMLQPGLPADARDNRDYYELQVDVAGAVFDSHFDDYNAPLTGAGATRRFGHEEWSSQVERAVFVDSGHFYSIELALPWSALVRPSLSEGYFLALELAPAIPPRPGDVWRLNLYSFRDGQRFALAWSPLRSQGNFHRASRFGRVRFE